MLSCFDEITDLSIFEQVMQVNYLGAVYCTHYAFPYLNSRKGRVRSLCQLHQGNFAIDTAKSILQDHQGHICMHGDFETRGSQISRLSSPQGEHWFIDRPFPCQQNYKLITFPTTTERKHQPVELNQ